MMETILEILLTLKEEEMGVIEEDMAEIEVVEVVLAVVVVVVVLLVSLPQAAIRATVRPRVTIR